MVRNVGQWLSMGLVQASASDCYKGREPLNASTVRALALVALIFPTCAELGNAASSRAINGAGSTFGARIVNADAEPQNWLSTGRNYEETRYSVLDKINATNINGFGLQWAYDLDTNNGQEGTPLAVDGVLYTTSAWSKVQAFDIQSGKLLWQFDPDVPRSTLVKGCCDAVNRGVAFWDGKVYVGAFDGRLIAIDAKTGKQIWSVITVDQSKGYTITGAPRIVKGKVIIGNGGAELGVRGYITAYDAETGAQQWRFFTVPGEPGKKDGAPSDAVFEKFAGKTWSGNWWKASGGGGGGTVWDSMAYDPDLDLLYIGVGNASYWNAAYRSPGGLDNLFLASIVALRPETGEYVWHYQETPGDEWDYTSTQQMIVADLDIDGHHRKVVMHAPKNGFFYVLDRATGELISAEPFMKQTWAKGIDKSTGRPLFDPDAFYDRTDKVWTVLPGAFGAHSWNPMSYSAQTGLVYIPVQEIGGAYQSDPNFKPLPKGTNLGINTKLFSLPRDASAMEAIKASLKGYLVAWDPRKQKEVWRAPHSGPFNGGVLSTGGGLVFQGDVDGFFNVYDAKTGKKLWSFDAGSAISAAPITYTVKGKQYVSVLAGWGGAGALATGELEWTKDGPRRNKSRVLTFALGGTAALATRESLLLPKLSPPPQFGTPAMIADGEGLYTRTCQVCHGANAVSGGVLPDLRYSAAIADENTWKAILVEGVLADKGMVSFEENYTPEELQSIRAYIIDEARWRAKDQ